MDQEPQKANPFLHPIFEFKIHFQSLTFLKGTLLILHIYVTTFSLKNHGKKAANSLFARKIYIFYD